GSVALHSTILFSLFLQLLFSFNGTATTGIYTLSLHDALPIPRRVHRQPARSRLRHRPGPSRRSRQHPLLPRIGHVAGGRGHIGRSEEHTSELQSRRDLVCRLLLEKKKIIHTSIRLILP